MDLPQPCWWVFPTGLKGIEGQEPVAIPEPMMLMVIYFPPRSRQNHSVVLFFLYTFWLSSYLGICGGCDMDAVTKAELETVLLRIRGARADLIRVERESGCDLRSVITKLDEVVRRLTSV